MSSRRRHLAGRLGRGAAVVAVALLGATAGLLLGGSVGHRVGPFDAHLALRPALTGDARVQVPPLGAVAVDSHDGPLQLQVRLDQLRQADAQRLLRDPARLAAAGDEAAEDLRAGLLRLVVQTVLSVFAGALLACLLVFRTRGRTLVGGLLAVVLLAGTGGAAAVTWRPDALREPTYSGLLANAPALVGDVRDIATRFGVYRRQLAALVTNVSRLYDTASTLPTYTPDAGTIRLLHVSDIHLNPAGFSVVRSIVQQFTIDAVVDTGDLTDHGTAAEAGIAGDIGRLGVPYVFIRGNHDSRAIQAAVARRRNAVVLDGGPPQVVAGLTFAGIGDPRFTPDKTTRDDKAPPSSVVANGSDLALAIRSSGTRPDLALVHDPAAAPPLAGMAPLVLAGHRHKRSQADLGVGTTLLVQGSTGGAGLRGLEGEEPTPLTCTVLYLGRTSRELQAYDEITVGGLGESEVTIRRRAVVGTP